ncbi:MAG: efflux RND transporter periplasmic adaptor subunit [Bryobacterales bacterium]|nr:efflux RND transporter periplasmic adaptor subunit [Bryobacterales bacterium]
MDISRPDLARKKTLRRIFWIVIAVLAVGALSLAVSRLKPAAPTVEASTVWRDTVKRGPMLRQVRGLGTLVPEEILLLPALSEGRVARVVNRPGVEVTPNTVILTLTNPDLEIQAQDAEWKVREAEAKTVNLRVELDTKRLDLEANMAKLQSELVQARLKSERDDALAKEGLAVILDVKISRATKEELEKRFDLDKKRIEIYEDSVKAQMAAQSVQMEQLKAALALAREKVKRLTVTAGTHGVLQEVNVEVGQQVAPGTQMAKVAQPETLKAQIRIPETQAQDVQIGQPALIDTRNGTVDGVVARIDPAVIDGTVTVDVRLTGKLPSGARPDLSVDGTVELERLEDVIYMGRPAFGQPNSTIGVFKMEADGRHASRVNVRLGRNSVNFIEVLEGLRPGDEVVLSDMSQWDAYDRVRLN